MSGHRSPRPRSLPSEKGEEGRIPGKKEEVQTTVKPKNTEADGTYRYRILYPMPDEFRTANRLAWRRKWVPAERVLAHLVVLIKKAGRQSKHANVPDCLLCRPDNDSSFVGKSTSPSFFSAFDLVCRHRPDRMSRQALPRRCARSRHTVLRESWSRSDCRPPEAFRRA